MDIIQSIILGIIQGITEFLPVSSSGHLALLHNYFGEINIGFDVAIHFATLLAIFVYFFRDVVKIVVGFFSFNTKNENFKIAIYLIIASIPAGIFGYFIKDLIDGFSGNLLVLGFGFLLSGMFLMAASRINNKNNKIKSGNAFIIGIAQALAIFPGISRSGSTVSTGVLCGISKEKAIRFSFLLAVPAIIGANILKFKEISLINAGNLVAGSFFAFIFGLVSIFLFMKKIKIKSFKWLAFYCWLLALISWLAYLF